MNIAYIVPSTINSGPIKVVWQLVKKLSGSHKVDLYYFKDVPEREHLVFDIVTKKIDFFEKIDFASYDIVHSHTILADAYVWYHKRKNDRTKFVSTLHNYAYEDLQYSYGIVKGTLLAFVWNIVTLRHDRLVVLSQNALAYYQKRWFNRSLTYVYNGIEVEDDAEVKVQIDNRDTIKIGTIASAGGINKRKGIDQTIRALALLPLHYALYIAGKENEESTKLKLLAQELGVAERVSFVGYVSDIKKFIDEMDLFVISSRSEGFPLSLQEIVGYKKPVVCSSIPIFREIFSNDEVCFFDLDDIRGLALEIEKCYGERERFVPKAYERFIQNYTSDIMAKKYLEVYLSLGKTYV